MLFLRQQDKEWLTMSSRIFLNGLDIFLGRVDQEGMDLFAGQWQRMVIGRVCMSIIPPFVARGGQRHPVSTTW